MKVVETEIVVIDVPSDPSAEMKRKCVNTVDLTSGVMHYHEKAMCTKINLEARLKVINKERED